MTKQKRGEEYCFNEILRLLHLDLIAGEKPNYESIHLLIKQINENYENKLAEMKQKDTFQEALKESLRLCNTLYDMNKSLSYRQAVYDCKTKIGTLLK